MLRYSSFLLRPSFFSLVALLIFDKVKYVVQIEVETVDRTGTFLGSLWESKHNVAITLLEAGLAKLQTSFGTDRIPDAHLLERAEQSAKKQKLKVSSAMYHVIQLSSF